MSSKTFLTLLAMSTPLLAPCAVLAAGPGFIELAQAPQPKNEIVLPKDPPPKAAPKKTPPPNTAPKLVAPPKTAPPKTAPKLVAPPRTTPPPKIVPKTAPPTNVFKKAPEKTVVPPKIAPVPKGPPAAVVNPGVRGKNIPPVVPKTGTPPPPKGATTAAKKQPVIVVPGRKIEAAKRPPPPKSTEVKNLIQLKGARKQTTELGGKRIVIVEPDNRRIVRQDGRSYITYDDNERFRRQWRDTRYERRGGLELSVTLLPGGFYLYTEYDRDRRPLRRYRRGPDGRDIILFDNRDFYRRHRGSDWYRHAFVELPPPVINIPRREYIVDYEDASPDFIYDTLYAPPIEDIDRRYSLAEIRYSPSLRNRMRRVDLNSINFAFGSWEIDPSQYRKLERVADAMNRIIEQDSSEVFMVEGYTDAVGEAEDNLTLSDRRAESVAIILTQEFGVPSENMTTQGYGEQYLKIATDGEEPRNRYVAIRRVTPMLDR